MCPGKLTQSGKVKRALPATLKIYGKRPVLWCSMLSSCLQLSSLVECMVLICLMSVTVDPVSSSAQAAAD